MWNYDDPMHLHALAVERCEDRETHLGIHHRPQRHARCGEGFDGVVEAEDTATKEELLNLAIEEMTRNTTIWKVKKFDKVKGF